MGHDSVCVPASTRTTSSMARCWKGHDYCLLIRYGGISRLDEGGLANRWGGC